MTPLDTFRKNLDAANRQHVANLAAIRRRELILYGIVAAAVLLPMLASLIIVWWRSTQ
jgi:hypothetical protein